MKFQSICTPSLLNNMYVLSDDNFKSLVPSARVEKLFVRRKLSGIDQIFVIFADKTRNFFEQRVLPFSCTWNISLLLIGFDLIWLNRIFVSPSLNWSISICVYLYSAYKSIVLLIFTCMTCVSIYFIPSIDVGLDQQLSMAKDSYVYKYFQVRFFLVFYYLWTNNWTIYFVVCR